VKHHGTSVPAPGHGNDIPGQHRVEVHHREKNSPKGVSPRKTVGKKSHLPLGSHHHGSGEGHRILLGKEAWAETVCRGGGEGPPVVSGRGGPEGRDRLNILSRNIGKEIKAEHFRHVVYHGLKIILSFRWGHGSVKGTGKHVVQKESRGSVDRSEAVLGGKPREGRGEKLLVVEDFFLPGDRTVIEDQQNGYRNGS